GLVGRNGRGKTTLLNLLLNKYEYTGNISSNVNFTYFPFKVGNPNQLVCEILWDICPQTESWEILKEFSYLQLDKDVLYSQFNSLSNGEQTKTLLAGLFLNDNNYLLIDEPTNHLDINSRQVVANYLNKKKSFILISHDRAFLDECVDHILSINKKNIEITQGNFSCWLDNFNNQQEYETALNEKLQKEISRLSKAASRNADWANKLEATKYGNGPVDRGYIGHKSAKMMKRAKAAENRQNKAIEQKSQLLQNVEKTDNLKLSPLSYKMNKLIIANDLQIKYNEKTICEPINLEICEGDRILLEGKNGSGKSSLLKIITGEKINYTGKISVPSDLIISYIPQSFEHLKGSILNFIKNNKINQPLFRAILEKMGFDKNDYDNDLTSLSEGQKKKILIAKSLSEQAHLYIWDEPLNYLDIHARIQLEKLIQSYSPTLIFVEHDKTFQQNICNKILSLEI
ncbi:MAG: ABC-F type ribosomal protection protein, partial [Clostridia bacterium]|nr:ABC-F type ribosomal protection protein [Clostridia bacterium]